MQATNAELVSITPELEARQRELDQQLERERAREAEIAQCDAEELAGLREAVAEQEYIIYLQSWSVPGLIAIVTFNSAGRKSMTLFESKPTWTLNWSASRHGSLRWPRRRMNTSKLFQKHNACAKLLGLLQENR